MQPNLIAVTAFIILSFFSHVNGPILPSNPEGTISPNKVQEINAVRITGQMANAYVKDEITSEVVTYLPRGTQIDVLKSTEDWYQISTSNGPAWIRKWLATPISNKNAAPKERYVAAYYTENYPGDSLSYKSMEKNQSIITTVAPFLYQVKGDGILAERETSFPIKKLANSRGIPFIPIVHNYDPKLGFDKDAIHSILVSQEKRSLLVKNIANLIKERGYNGVNIDFENLHPSDRQYLNLFMKELWEVLKPQGAIVTMSVPAKTSDFSSSEWIGAHDYETLAQYVDYIMIMTYDQHNPNSRPGPIASIKWVKEVIEYALKHIPKEKILMGIAAYGYDWDTTLNTAKARTFSNIMALARAIAKEKGTENIEEVLSWDSINMTHYIDYKDSTGKSHQVWFEDSRSLSHKLDLINQYDLAGIVIWRLGIEDEKIWETIKDKLMSKSV